MSTGYKINHASDNAANYSISRNMSTQLSACDVAADNIAMGMDLLSVAQDTIAGMQSRASRIHALVTQARNGTYGADSLNAMTQEANALVSEINRLYANTEYNGIKLFDGVELPDWAQEVKATAGTIDGKSLEQCALENNGFIAKVVEDTPDVIVTDPKNLTKEIKENTNIGIGNAETLAKLAELVNSGTTCEGKTIILTEDIDLSAYQEGEGWTPIGTESNKFQGAFNGNGHKITGLYINRPNADYQGLFGYTAGEIKNVGIEGAKIIGRNDTAGLVGRTQGTITNSYATGNIKGSDYTGGLAGNAQGAITNSYSTGNIVGNENIGGLAGYTSRIITSSYASGDVSGYKYTGGLIGNAINKINNCYATGTITGEGYVGGLIGRANGSSSTISGCYAAGNVMGSASLIGGLVGYTQNAVNMCYATGDVSGSVTVGGLIGQLCKLNGSMDCGNLFTTGKVSGENRVGSFIGTIKNTQNGTSFSVINITNAAAKEQGNMISGTYSNASGSPAVDYDMTTWLENIEVLKGSETTLQVGINSGNDSQISVDTSLSYGLNISDLTSDSAYNSITNFLNKLSKKSTELGAAQNRLESALESNLVKMNNLTSSLSTIRDADISEVSSDYIRQQILQQACATLMSTANQSPSIALQLL